MRLSQLGRGRLRSSWVVGLVLCLFSACDGCGGCGGDSRVPFKRPTAEQAAEKPTDAAVPTKTQDAGANLGTLLRFADAPSRVQLPQGEVAHEGGHIHAALLRAREKEQDALLLSTDRDGLLLVERSVVGAAGYGTPRKVMALPMPQEASCQMLTGALEQPSKSHIVVHATLTCEQGVEGAESADAQFLARSLYVLSDEAYPRLLERFQFRDLTASLSGAEEATLSVAATLIGEDVDGDGHTDLRLTLTPRLGEQAFDPMAFDLIDRPGGLSMDSKEPEHTLKNLADQALQSLRKQPETALKTAAEARMLHDGLCRGDGRSAVQVGGRDGLPCERSSAIGRALAVSAVAQVRLGALVDALATQEEMRHAHVRVLSVDEKRVDAALANVPRVHRYRFVEGPPVTAAVQLPLHLPPVGFIDNHHVLLRGTPPQDYSLVDGNVSPTSVVAPGFAFRDPTGQYVATELVRDCEGDKLRVYPASQVIMGRSVGQPARTWLVVADAQPNCTALNRPQRIAPKDLDLLRWGRDGLLFSQHGQPLVLHVDEEMNALGPAAPPAGGSLPGRQEPDALSASPPLLPLATRLGVLLVDLRNRTGTVIDTAALPGRPDSVALSPDGSRIAITVGPRLFVGQPAPPSAGQP